MLSTGFFFSAAAPEGFAAAPEGAALLSCVFMNHFRMSDDCAPRKQSKNRSVVVRGQRTGNRIKNPLAKQISAEEGGIPTGARARERERGGKNALTISDAAMDGPGRPKSWRFFRILGAVRLVGELGF